MEQEIKEIRELAERNNEMIKENKKDIDSNFERINQNKYALDILKDYKREAFIWKIAFFITLTLLIIMAVHHFIIK